MRNHEIVRRSSWNWGGEIVPHRVAVDSGEHYALTLKPSKDVRSSNNISSSGSHKTSGYERRVGNCRQRLKTTKQTS